MNTTQAKTFTPAQQSIVAELCLTHDLDPSQISFDGDALVPIFDYEAVSSLSLRVTDIKDIDVYISERDDTGRSTAKCTVTLPSGQTRSVEDSAELGEVTGSGRKIETIRDADGIAQNRASRRGIRSVGVNLYNAHKAFIKFGGIAKGTTAGDPRAPNYREIHVLAEELDLITEGDKTVYQNYLAALFAGVESSKDLDDLQLHQLLVNLRAMAGIKRRDQKSAA